jgi:putative phage-type endonuclease
MEKTGQAPEVEETEAMYWGKKHEDLVAQEFAERTGAIIKKPEAIFQSIENPIMLGNIDRLAFFNDNVYYLSGFYPAFKINGNKNGILECKTSTVYKKDEWENDGTPQEYIIQVQHYLAITGYRWGIIAVLIGGNKFEMRFIERDEELINFIIQGEKKFWEMVESKTPPIIDGSQDAIELIKQLYPSAEPGTKVELPIEYEALVFEREGLSEQIKELELKKQEIENKIKFEIGNNESALTGQFLITYKNISAKRFDSDSFKVKEPELYSQYLKESSYRRLNIKPIK